MVKQTQSAHKDYRVHVGGLHGAGGARGDEQSPERSRAIKRMATPSSLSLSIVPSFVFVSQLFRCVPVRVEHDESPSPIRPSNDHYEHR